MKKQKRKNGQFLQGKSYPFILLWGMSYILAFAVSYLATQWAESVVLGNYDWTPRIALLFIFLLMSLPAVLQVQNIERIFKRSMQGWMTYHLVAATLTTTALLIFNPGTWWSVNNLLFNMPVYLVMSALAQTLWLWGRVRFAWLWLPISLFTSLGPGFAFQTTPINGNINAFLLVLHSLVQGGLMYFLLTHPKETEKAKNDFDTDEDDDERLQRLQEQDNQAAIAASLSDEQGSQIRRMF
jgi:hypothetical protein